MSVKVMGAVGFDRETAKHILNKSKGHCWYCGRFLTVESRYQKVTKATYAIDHLIPKSNGGNDDVSNLVPACWTCNGHKRDKTIEEFRKLKARLRAGTPRFTQVQVDYLNSLGVFLPIHEHYTFYFEKENLEGVR